MPERNKSKNTNSDTGRGRAVPALPAAPGRAPDVRIDIFEALGRLFVLRIEGLAVAAPRRIELGEHKLVRLPTGMLSGRSSARACSTLTPSPGQLLQTHLHRLLQGGVRELYHGARERGLEIGRAHV